MKWVIMMKNAQLKEAEGLYDNDVPHRDVNKRLLPTRVTRAVRKSVTVQHPYFHQIMLNHSKNALLLPTLERSSMYYNLRSVARKFTKIMHRI